MVTKLSILFLFVISLSVKGAEKFPLLVQGHAHNDYYHKRPLEDALECFFCSIEVDVFLKDGKFLVGHDRVELREDRTLERLYLDPLKKRVLDGKGYVYKEKKRITLFIDIKSDGKEAYAELRKLLKDYNNIVSGLVDGVWKERAVDIVVSGNRAKEMIANDLTRRVGIDGRISDFGSNQSNHLMPIISDRWSSHFNWRGEGSFSDKEKTKLRGMIQRAHKEGRRIRFWATPDKKSVWRELEDAGVDLINTDDLKGLSDFIRTYNKK